VQEVGVDVEEAVSAPTEAALPFDESGFVDFAVAGTEASGEFRCTDCGYGAVVQHTLPPCPMCGGTVWMSRGPRFVD
jgi:rubrerythrin